MNIKEYIKTHQPILNVYFTAGFPNLNDTGKTILALQHEGAQMIEVGMPYSDPMADGETIQKSSAQAIQNGMTLDTLFSQLIEIKEQIKIPLVFMGYLNQWMQFGKEKFLAEAKEAGISGLIIPDLPLDVYETEYKSLVESYDIDMTFLITPNTSEERIKKAAELSTGFLYVVSQSSITGAKSGITNEQLQYFERIKNLGVATPKLIGFGISSAETFNQACQYADGAIIGSAFIKAVSNKEQELEQNISGFISSILVKA